MSYRNIVLFVGLGFIVAGLWLAFLWINQARTPAATTTRPEERRPAVLIAMHPLPSGSLLRADDIGWKDIEPGEIRTGLILRGESNEADFHGALTRRDFAEGEPLQAADLVKATDRRFLADVLRPNYRAVTVFVDASQGLSGLLQPGDHVDVNLTQTFGDNLATAARRTAGETIVYNSRVLALDQTLGLPVKPPAQAPVPAAASAAPERSVPKTVTLELTEQQVQILFVSLQLGKLQLALRPRRESGPSVAEARPAFSPLTWAADASQAIRLIATGGGGAATPENAQAPASPASSAPEPAGAPDVRTAPACPARPASTGSTLESLIRRPPFARTECASSS